LDVGAGTGRTVIWLKNRFPELKIIGIEPVAELRQQGYKKGLSPEDLLDGDAYQLSFSDNSFDLVCEFAVLHHLKQPERAINEMNRVAAKMICISDSNFMGQGSLPVRLLKYLIFSLGLWPVANWIKTKGKGYTVSEEDGLAYSYSVYQSLPNIRQAFQKLRIMTTNDHYVKKISHLGQILTASTVLLIGLEKKNC
jgi:ubiquinone/menaquinone biosynthesis C-methylase UbiE